jgi:hypothetical protein
MANAKVDPTISGNAIMPSPGSALCAVAAGLFSDSFFASYSANQARRCSADALPFLVHVRDAYARFLPAMADGVQPHDARVGLLARCRLLRTNPAVEPVHLVALSLDLGSSVVLCLANLGHAFASASRFRKAASPASDTLTHFGSGEASAS